MQQPDSDGFVTVRAYVHANDQAEPARWLTSLFTDLARDYMWNLDVPVFEHAGTYPECNMKVGECSTDEWMIVWCCSQISSQYPITFSITDQDGEFLLIEAAVPLPRWIAPDCMSNRVFMHKGGIKIIGPDVLPLDSNITPEVAVKALIDNSEKCVPSVGITRAIDRKLAGYPAKGVTHTKHYANVVVPSRVATVLQKYPYIVNSIFQNIPPLPTDKKVIRRIEAAQGGTTPPRELPKLNFMETDDEAVILRIRFTRCQYLRLQATTYSMPGKYTYGKWKLPDIDVPRERLITAARRGARLCYGLYLVLENSTSDPLTICYGSPEKQDTEELYRRMDIISGMDDALLTAVQEALTEAYVPNDWVDDEDETWIKEQYDDLMEDMKRQDAQERLSGAQAKQVDNIVLSEGPSSEDDDDDESDAGSEMKHTASRFERLLKHASGYDGIDSSKAQPTMALEQITKELEGLGLTVEDLCWDDDEDEVGSSSSDGAHDPELSGLMDAMDSHIRSMEPVEGDHIAPGTMSQASINEHMKKFLDQSMEYEGVSGPASMLLKQLGHRQ